MKLLDMPSLRLPPGRLTVWRASAPPMTDAAWAADQRRASHVQEAHVTYALEAASEGPLPPSWLGCAFDLPAEIDASAFTTALRDWTDRHETLRSHLSLASNSTHPTGGSRLQRMTLPAGAVRIRPSAEGDFTDGRELAQYLEALFDGEAGPLDWPGYLCATISHPEATTVCLAADHSVMDGYSILQTAHEIHTLYAAALAASPALPATASYLDFAEAERTAADALTTDHESIVRWRQFLNEAGGRLPEFPIPVGDGSHSHAAQPSGYTELLDAFATHAFDHVCRAAGGDTFSGVLACLAKLGLEITGSEEFHTMAPFHTRTSTSRSSIGWYVGMAPIAFRLSATASFAETVRAAASGLDGAKELARIPVPRVAELLDRPLHDPFMVSFMDLRRAPGARDWNTWRAVVLRSRSTDADDVYFWIARTHDGLVINYRHPATGPAGIAVPRYVARIQHVLASVASSAHWPASPHPTGDECP